MPRHAISPFQGLLPERGRLLGLMISFPFGRCTSRSEQHIDRVVQPDYDFGVGIKFLTPAQILDNECHGRPPAAKVACPE
jgi:hypothetical protein